jgi:aspartyl protease family protein
MFSTLDSGDQQNLIYSVLLLVFLISSVVFRRSISASQALKYGAWWVGIGFVMVAIYAYRFEFRDFKNRILGELNPTTARLNDDGQMVIDIASDGHFYLDVKINDRPIRFMIDTGASSITIDIDQAQKLGINTKNLVFNRRFETANGVVYGADVKLEKFTIGNVEFDDLHASVNGVKLGTPLLGMSFLRKFKKYEFFQDKLILTIQ